METYPSAIELMTEIKRQGHRDTRKNRDIFRRWDYALLKYMCVGVGTHRDIFMSYRNNDRETTTES